MDHFAEIFVAFQQRGKTEDPESKLFTSLYFMLRLLTKISEIAALEKELEPWTKPDARGKQRMHFEDNPFPVKQVHAPDYAGVLTHNLGYRVVGVFDTVGSIGMPTSITSLNPMSDNMKRVFGFNDRKLGHYIEHAYHAMALNEKRADFVSIILQFPPHLINTIFTGYLQIRANCSWSPERSDTEAGKPAGLPIVAHTHYLVFVVLVRRYVHQTTHCLLD